MRVMVLVKATEDSERGVLPTADLFEVVNPPSPSPLTSSVLPSRFASDAK